MTATSLEGQASLLRERIASRSAVVGVIGLGYVGLPLALVFEKAGFCVLGFDSDPEKVAALARSESYIRHVDAGRVARMVAGGRFGATVDLARLREADAILVCVPTPLTPQREPDMSYVVRSTRAVRAALRPGQLVVLESTTYPGTTDELMKPILEESGLVAGRDFFLAFSPEREDPGNRSFSTATIPKVVGGCDPASGDLAEALYAAALTRVVRVGSAKVAEASKITENVFRAVNIALVNELKVIFDRMGVDVWDVLDAAETKPFGFMRFNPGPGWGGHCIPLDPFYLTWKAREYGVGSKFIEAAGEVNTAMPEYVVGKLRDALNARGKAVQGARILLLGLAYKKDIDDTRESPALEIFERLLALGGDVVYHDPHVPRVPRTRRHPSLAGRESVALSGDVVAGCDAVLVVTDHSAVDYEAVLRAARLVVDTRHVYRTPDPRVIPA